MQNHRILTLIACCSLPAAAQAEERCYDELGHKIPGACEDQGGSGAQPKSSEPSAVEESASSDRHTGFFLRMTLGGAGSTYDTTFHDVSPEPDMRIRASGGEFSLAIGGSPIQGLAIYGLIVGNGGGPPTIELEG